MGHDTSTNLSQPTFFDRPPKQQTPTNLAETRSPQSFLIGVCRELLPRSAALLCPPRCLSSVPRRGKIMITLLLVLVEALSISAFRAGAHCTAPPLASRCSQCRRPQMVAMASSVSEKSTLAEVHCTQNARFLHCFWRAAPVRHPSVLTRNTFPVRAAAARVHQGGGAGHQNDRQGPDKGSDLC